MNDKIIKIASVVFDTEIEKLTEDASPDTIEKWDSLNHMNFVSALEEEFGLIFNDEDIGEMLNLKLVAHIIDLKLKKN